MATVLFTEGFYDRMDPGMRKLGEFAAIKQMRETYLGIGVTPIVTEDEIIEQIRDVEFVVTKWARISRKVLDSAVNLRMVVSNGNTKLENVDLDTTTRKGILVSAVPWACDPVAGVAEHAFTLLLAMWRKLFNADRMTKAGDFWARRKPDLLPFQLKDRTIGIIGFGNIGRKVAKIANAFEMKVLSYDPYIPQGNFGECTAKSVDFQTLLRNSDVVTIHCTLTEETRHLIGERELKLMKPTAFLVNTARGEIVDEQALYRALRNSEISGAGLDVYEKEPPDVGNPLLELGNVIATPHMAGLTYECMSAQAIRIADEIIRVLKGEAPRYLVKPGNAVKSS